MSTKEKTDWNLLAKYLAGETTENENAAVDRWLSFSPENKALLGKLKSDWKIMNTMNKQFNVDDAWNKLHGRITAHVSQEGTESGEIIRIQHRKIGFTLVRIAASIILIAILGISIVLVTGKSQNLTITTASNEKQKSVVLPDGSKVFLNGSTRLSYAKKFRKNIREVALSGEAFFEVTPDKTKPFLIHADHAAIRVVGTSFNIDTKRREKEVEVYVSTGIVDFYESVNPDNHVLLHPGDLGTMTSGDIKAEKSRNENSIAWKTGKMDFQETRLSEAIEVLNKLYGVNIVCTDAELAGKQTTGTYIYPEESLDTILAVFCKLNYLKVEKSDNKIYLSR